MKKYIMSALCCALMLPCFTSCKDMLEEEVYGKATTDALMANEDNLVLLVAQAYADIKFVHDHWGYWGVNTLTSDEAICPTRAGGDWDDNGYWKNLNTHNWNPYGEAFKSIWNRSISGAVLCNSLLSTLTTASDETKAKPLYKQYVGELEVLRSYYYYMLFDCFGRIPYMEDYSKRVEPLMEPQAVWVHLVACLELNAPDMQKVNDGNRQTLLGRATQGLAYTLLARLYLNAESFGCTPENVMAVKRTLNKEGNPVDHILEDVNINISSSQDFYTNAARCCDMVINSKSYEIEDNYFSNFKINNEASKENIFVIIEDGDKLTERNVDKVKNKLQITFLTLHYDFQKIWPGLQDKPWNGFCARPDYLKIYDDYDVRGPGYENDGTRNTKQWTWFFGPMYDPKKDTLLVDAGKSCTADSLDIITKEVGCDPKKYAQTPANILSHALRNSGARMIKYEIDTKGKTRFCENDFVLFRYADVILMKIEAEARGGHSDTPGNYAEGYKTMKRRAFAYSPDPESAYDAAYPDAKMVSEDLITGILAERGRELVWENCRRRDLIRFGQFEKIQYVADGGATNEYRRWFPIPFLILSTSQVDENGNKYWTQNEGYN